MKRTYGKVRVSGRMIDENPDTVARVFAKLGAVILRCEYLYHRDAFEYQLDSPRFREVPPGEIPPEYRIEVTSHFDDTGIVIDFEVEPREVPDISFRTRPTSLETIMERLNHRPQNEITPKGA